MKKLFLLFIAVSVSLAIHGVSEEPSQGGLVRENDIVGLWLMGQSLCEGSQSLPIVTSTDSKWGNYRFKCGVRTWAIGDHSNQPEARPDEQFVFVPLAAKKSGGLGETIANGYADHLKATLPTSAPFLVAYAGQGGRMIDELSEIDQSTDSRTPESRQHGGGYYKTSLDDALRAREQAKALGKGFSIAALVWMQGEGNGGPTGGINPSRWDLELPRPSGQKWYRDRLIAYRKKWSHDLRAITGQVGEIPMFTYQTLGAAGEAQLMAADSDPDITIVGPHYMVSSGINSRYSERYGAAIHLSADGERWYGEQVAKVVRRVLAEDEKWQPLRQRKAWIDSDRTSVMIEFLVPRPPLVIDNAFLPSQQYQVGDGYSSLGGFRIRSSAGDGPLISAIEVESPNVIRIHLTSALRSDAEYNVSYGLPYAGQIGKIASIRDGASVADQPTTEILIEGDVRKQLSSLLSEGAFNVSNMDTAGKYTQATIRQVDEENGSTILRFENRELRDGVKFEKGQALTALRPFSYGNLRDSDSEKAIYQFADPEYGNRVGQSYPLWNWCVLFQKFPISEK